MDEEQLRILLIEDDEDDFILTRELLSDISQKRYHLSRVKSYQEGLRHMKQNAADLYLVDYHLGNDNGIELVETARREGCVGPIIFLSGEDDSTIDTNALRSGATDYLVKGRVNSSTLERSLRYALERYRNEVERRKLEAERSARQEAEEREQYYRDIAEAIPQLVWIAKPNGDHEYFNKRWYEFTKMDTEKSKGNGWLACIHPDDLTKTKKAWEQSLRTGDMYSQEFRMKNADEDCYQWFLGRALPVKDSRGKISKWFGTCTDIDDQKSAENSLRFMVTASNLLGETLDYQQTLANIAQLLVPTISDWCEIEVLQEDGSIRQSVIFHKDKRKTALAKKIYKNFPISLEDPFGPGHVIRTGKSELVPLVESDQLNGFSKGIEHKKMLTKLQFHSYLCTPLKARGVIYGAITLITSESKRTFTNDDKGLVEELAHRASLAIDNAILYRTAREGVEIRDEFLNIASHELKTPLTSLQLQLQILERKTQQQSEIHPQDLASMLQTSERQLKRLGQLINNLLDVSRISSNHFELQTEKVDLSEIVEDVIGRHEEAIKASGSKIKVKNGIKVMGNWDAFRLDQVVTNLLSNAIKYGQGKPITIDLQKEKNTARLIVTDQGIGIDQKDKERVFNRFERTDVAKQYGGLGLGLYIVKQIVEAHEGEITVESKPNHGSSFIVILPCNTAN